MPIEPDPDPQPSHPLDYAGPRAPAAVGAPPPHPAGPRPAWVGWAMLFGTMFAAMILILAATLLAVVIITRR